MNVIPCLVQKLYVASLHYILNILITNKTKWLDLFHSNINEKDKYIIRDTEIEIRNIKIMSNPNI